MSGTTTSPADAGWLGLAGRVCVVTGGASGIGAETARQLARAGARVAVLDRDEAGAQALAQAIADEGGVALGVGVDVREPAAVVAAARRVEQGLGPCRVLVNNAGMLNGNSLLGVSPEQWNQLLSVNLSGALFCLQAFARQMIDVGQGGSLVHVGSVAGHHPMPYGGAYSVSKAGLMMLSRMATVELAAHRIRSNVVSPALVHTPLSDFTYRDPEVVRRRAAMIPAGRICEPAELAAAILFLASDRASYVNGQELLVDGGLDQTWMTLIPRPGMEQGDVR